MKKLFLIGLLSFGLAKADPEFIKLLKGSLPHLSPEQAQIVNDFIAKHDTAVVVDLAPANVNDTEQEQVVVVNTDESPAFEAAVVTEEVKAPKVEQKSRFTAKKVIGATALTAAAVYLGAAYKVDAGQVISGAASKINIPSVLSSLTKNIASAKK